MKSFQPQRSFAYALLFVLTLVVLNGCFGSTSRWSETGSGIVATTVGVASGLTLYGSAPAA